MAWSVVGQHGNTSNKTSATSCVLTIATNAVTAGDVLIVSIAMDNTSTTDGDNSEVTSVTDSQGNTYTKLKEYTNSQAAAAGGVTVSVWGCLVTTGLAITTDTITMNFSSARSAKAMGAESWRMSVGTSYSVAGSDGQPSDASASGPSKSISGLTSQEYLYIAVDGKEGPGTDTYTQDSNFTGGIHRGTSGGSGVANMTHESGYRILTGTGSTHAGSNSAALDWAGVLVALKEVSSSTTNVEIDVTAASTPTVVKLGELVRAISAGTTPTTPKQASLSRSISAGSTPTLPKQAQLPRSITAPSTATLSQAITRLQAITATVGSTVTRLLRPGKAVSVSEGSTMTLPGKAITRTLTFTAASTPSVVKQAIKTLAFSAGSMASLVATRLYMVAISVATGNGLTLTKQADKPITVSEGSTLTTKKAASKTLTFSAGTTRTLVKQAVKPLTFTAGTTVSLVKLVGKVISSTGGSLMSLLVSGPGGPVTYLQDITVTAATSVTSVYDHFVLHSAVLFTTETGTLSIKKAISRTLTFTASKVLTLLRGIYYLAPDPENNVFIETSGNSVGVSESENTITITEG